MKFASTRGGQLLPKNDPVLPAALAFDSSDFRRAAMLTTHFKKENPGYMQARTIAAHAAFNLGEYGQAAAIFREIINSSGGADNREEGYLLLSLLAEGKMQTPEFRSLLKKIREDKWHPFHEKSLKIDF